MCETWLDDSIKKDEVAIEGYVLVHRYMNRYGGGIGMYPRESLSFSQTLIHPSIEFLLNLKSRSLLCGLFYHPPSSPHAVATLKSALESLPPAKLKFLILLGDFNIDFLSLSDPLQEQIKSISDKLYLRQMVTAPTRVTPTTSTVMSTCLKTLVSPHVTSQCS